MSTVVACRFPAVQLACDPIGPPQVFTWLAFAENVNRLDLIGSMGTATATTPHAAFVRRQGWRTSRAISVPSELRDFRKCSGPAGGTVQIGPFLVGEHSRTLGPLIFFGGAGPLADGCHIVTEEAVYVGNVQRQRSHRVDPL